MKQSLEEFRSAYRHVGLSPAVAMSITGVEEALKLAIELGWYPMGLVYDFHEHERAQAARQSAINAEIAPANLALYPVPWRSGWMLLTTGEPIVGLWA